MLRIGKLRLNGERPPVRYYLYFCFVVLLTEVVLSFFPVPQHAHQGEWQPCESCQPEVKKLQDKLKIVTDAMSSISKLIHWAVFYAM